MMKRINNILQNICWVFMFALLIFEFMTGKHNFRLKFLGITDFETIIVAPLVFIVLFLLLSYVILCLKYKEDIEIRGRVINIERFILYVFYLIYLVFIACYFVIVR